MVSNVRKSGDSFDRYILDLKCCKIETVWMLIWPLVTPLDVVRVRLQSQPPVSPLAAFQRPLASSQPPFNAPPANLGVTACCREIFFINNHAEYCLAGSRISTISNSAVESGTACSVEEVQRRTFNSTFDGLKKIARNEGITTLWRGLSPTLVMTVPGNIIYFTGYDWLRFNKASPIKKLVPDIYTPLVAGAFARTVAAISVSPIEMFRTRIQASTSTSSAGHFADTLKGIRNMVQTKGYTSLWRGLTLTLWRDVPFSAFYWLGYETFKDSLSNFRERSRGRRFYADDSTRKTRSRSQNQEDHTVIFADSFISGALSGSLASILTMPFDVAKTRLQVFKDSRHSSGGEIRIIAPEERSTLRFLWHIFKQEGIMGLWKGWVARTLKIAPACAIMISSFEISKRMAREMNERAAEQRSSIQRASP